MASLKLSRRAMLRGLGGIAVALPALEAMMPARARADVPGIPKRFLACFGGASLAISGVTADQFVPDTIGPDYDLKLATQPLGDLGVSDRVSLVSGLRIPSGDLGSIPPGGRYLGFHNFCYGPLFSGSQPGIHDNGLPFPVNAPSSDQLVADAIGTDTKVRVMAYRVQASTYAEDSNSSGEAMSYRMGTGGLQPVTPKVSPQLIFQELFDGFAPPGTDPAAQAAAELYRQRRLSVLDLVAARTEKLVPQLGKADRIRMEQHLQLVRELETRIQNLNVGGGGEGCVVPPPLGPEPAIGAAYSDEDQRAEIVCDLIHLAFACDLSRSGALMFTLPQCGMDLEFLTGYSRSLHDVSHHENLDDLSRGIAWHVKHFARLVSKLRDTQEVDGSSLLDHCALTLFFEGGWGGDSVTPDALDVHSTEHMSVLIAGGAGNLQQGLHVSAPGKHPSSVINSAMRAVGVTTGFGEVTDWIPELFA